MARCRHDIGTWQFLQEDLCLKMHAHMNDLLIYVMCVQFYNYILHFIPLQDLDGLDKEKVGRMTDYLYIVIYVNYYIRR